MKFQILNTNFPKTEEGRVYHMEVKRGEVANRIITVGDTNRAKMFIQWLDKDTPVFYLESQRGFTTVTGKYHGVPISIVGIGMGLSMMDFFIREVRSTVDGQLAIIRFGSCGTIGAPKVGNMIIPSGAFAITRNYNYFSNGEDETSSNGEKPYNFTKAFYADPMLCKQIEKQLLNSFDEKEIFTGLNATCDSFYSSQGRQDENFRDCNSDIFKTITATYPNTVSLEMESFMLYHLASSSTSAPLKHSNRVSDKGNSIKAAATMMVFVDRFKNEIISPEKVQEVEVIAGKAVLDALVETELSEVHPESEECVWNTNTSLSSI
ncbi:6448_t:CDS:2 [Funneliformis mosseae]|uniref:6448_t:CDS:1 n=1 Tax=Funneliformis mosseae TaxID=27381 RepID=A0A9N8YTR0_FUNMO|nr:6448_t:CDS:2 [Funneliformis mosseae]